MSATIHTTEIKRNTIKADDNNLQIKTLPGSVSNYQLSDSQSSPTNTKSGEIRLKAHEEVKVEENKKEEERKVIPNPLLREKVGPIKEKSFDSEEILINGEPWKILELISFLRKTILSSFIRLNRGKAVIPLYTFYSLCIIANCVFCIMIYLEYRDNDEVIFFAYLSLLCVVFGVVTVGFMTYGIIKSIRNQWISINLIHSIFCFRIFNFCLGFILSLPLQSYHKTYSLLTLSFTFGACLLYACLVFACIVSAPFLLIGFLIETIIRLFQCKLSCPSYEKKKKKFKCQLFSYSKEAFGEIQCVICLDDMKERNEVLLLSCHQNHIFHENCIMEWMNKSLLCPICKRDLEFVLN